MERLGYSAQGEYEMSPHVIPSSHWEHWLQELIDARVGRKPGRRDWSASGRSASREVRI